MMRTWTLRALMTALALAVAASAGRATPPEFPSSSDEKLNLVLQQLSDVKSRLAAIQANQDLQIKSMQDDIDHLKTDMARLNDEVHRLSTTTTNIAASINPAAPVSPQLATGNIVLENRYNAPATVVINNQNYRVQPFERVSVPATVGRFTYAVYTDDFGLVQPPSNRFLTPGRDFPITIHP